MGRRHKYVLDVDLYRWLSVNNGISNTIVLEIP